MSYTRTTEFYGIPLPDETDLVNPMDDNDAKVRIDTDLHGAVQNASSAVETANSASDAAAAATSGLEELSGIVNNEKGKLTALTARVTAAENEIDDVRSDSNDMITAFIEASATSTHNYTIGDYFIYNNVLYKATSAIAISDTIVPNTNCTATNVTTEIDTLNTAVSDVEVTVSKVKNVSSKVTPSTSGILNAIVDENSNTITIDFAAYGSFASGDITLTLDSDIALFASLDTLLLGVGGANDGSTYLTCVGRYTAATRTIQLVYSGGLTATAVNFHLCATLN